MCCMRSKNVHNGNRDINHHGARSMKKAHLDLIKHALAEGCRIAVRIDGDIELKASTAYNAIKEAVECADEANMVIMRGPRDNYEFRETAFIVHDGDDDTVADYTFPRDENEQGFIDAWFDTFYP